MNRRDLLLGAGCVAALGTAQWLKPRTTLSLLTDKKIADIIPTQFGAWRTDTADGIVQPPPQEGSLAATLYNETVSLSYRRAGDDARVMLLVAHGDSQSDTLQLHRPEVCYPAVGFEVDGRETVQVPLANGATMPAVGLATHAGARREDVLYWTRLGEYLPMDMGEQRRDRLKTAMAGFIADGVLFRTSTLRLGDAPQWPVLAEFASALIQAVPRLSDRAALVGTANAKATVAQV